MQNLFDGNYRNYLDSDGKLDENKRASFEAFAYFAQRMLQSIADNVLGKKETVDMKTKPLSVRFSISDEAFALLMMENYCQRWERVLLQKQAIEEIKRPGGSMEGQVVPLDSAVTLHHTYQGNGSTAPDNQELPTGRELAGMCQRKNPFFATKWTSSEDGYQSNGWSNEGITRFNQLYYDVEELRKNHKTGQQLEEALIVYWRGFDSDENAGEDNRSAKKKVMKAHVQPKWMDAIK